MKIYLRRLWKHAQPNSWLEWLGIVLTIASCIWFLDYHNYSWQSIIGIPLMVVFGWIAGDMVWRLGILRW
jgi:hypothetical protein